MEEELLRRLGLSSNEARAYFALVKTGETTSGGIIKESGVPSSKIYSALEGLIAKGLVGYIVEGKVRHFRPNNPSVLRALVDAREEEVGLLKEKLEECLPELVHRFEQEKPRHGAEIFEGMRGIKEFFEYSLKLSKRGECMLTLGYPPLASELLHGFFVEFHEKKDKKGVWSKTLFDYEAWFMKKRQARKYALQRYLPRGTHTPAFVHIFRDYVGIMVVTQEQKTCIAIRNREVAESYRQYFELLWKGAKKS